MESRVEDFIQDFWEFFNPINVNRFKDDKIVKYYIYKEKDDLYMKVIHDLTKKTIKIMKDEIYEELTLSHDKFDEFKKIFFKIYKV